MAFYISMIAAKLQPLFPGLLQVNASQVAPAVTLTCDTTGTPLQAAAPPAAARLSTANAAESLILYAMSKVAAGMTR